MANRQQRRTGKKLLNQPELKEYVDKFCMEFSNLLVDGCEKAKNEAKLNNVKVDFSKVQEQLEPLMKLRGEELGKKVKEIVEKKNPSNKPKITVAYYKS